ncbi:MAG TPA: RNase adapter RapZ, partial [Candidatus Obscuribacterales bacterium]
HKKNRVDMVPKQSRQLQFVIVTGTSGAGKSMALRHLEDMGFFCTDNMVPALLVSFVDLISTQFQRIAMGVDLRGGGFFDELSGCLHTLKDMGFKYKILFLDAQEDVLVRRFSETRRRHPLQNEDLSLLESIRREKDRLQDIREQADLILDTSRMKTAELKHVIAERLIEGEEIQQGLVVTVTSFGYRYGIPMDADLTFDVRFLPNPYYNQNLRPYTGLDRPVESYVLNQEVTQTFIRQFFDFVNYLIPHYRTEGKSNLNVAIGCTGGRHRSVAITHTLARMLKEQDYYVLEKHRDINKDEARYQSPRKRRAQDLCLVALGGGTGLSTLLRGFKRVFHDITAVVTVSDDGGSSGRLRKDMGILPPGDIRNCLLALADEEDLLTDLLNYRFAKGQGELAGHSFGNLFLSAMAEVTGDFNLAIKESSKVLAIRGRVLPVSLDNVTLEAEMEDGTVVAGESSITHYGGNIRRLLLRGETLAALPEAVEAIENADAVIMGPGSLYTSVMPHLLFPEVVEALRNHRGPRIFICNIMSQRGETTNYTVSDYIETLYAHAGARDWLDYVLVNTHTPSPELLARYAEEQSQPVVSDDDKLKTYPFEVVNGDFLSQSGFIRHDATALADAVLNILKQRYFAGQA